MKGNLILLAPIRTVVPSISPSLPGPPIKLGPYWQGVISLYL